MGKGRRENGDEQSAKGCNGDGDEESERRGGDRKGKEREGTSWPWIDENVGVGGFEDDGWSAFVSLILSCSLFWDLARKKGLGF